MELELTGETALVTGAASGIGRAIALRLAREGAAVVVVDKDGRGADETVELIVAAGGTALGVACDLSDSEQIAAAAASAMEWNGPIRRVCLNAGIGGTGNIQTITAQDWRQIMSINLDSQFLLLQHLLGPMIAAGGGSIVATSSVGAFICGHPTSSPAYGVSKAAVIQLMRHIAARHAADGIRANAVCPGSVETNFGARTVSGSELAPSVIAAPVGRRAQPEEIADPVAFLLSERASYITGQALVIDGGLTIV